MGGDKARTSAAAEAPIITPDPPKKKKARGGFFGVGEVKSAALQESSSRRSTFLGA